MFNKTKFNFWLDATIFAAFLVTAITGLLLWLVMPHESGSRWFTFLGLSRQAWINVHQWVGLGMLVGAGAHIALHWKWIVCAADRFFKKLTHQARINFTLDSLLFAAFFLTSLSGLLAWLALSGGGYRGGRNLLPDASLLGLTRNAWNDLHLWAGVAMMGILVVHLALHWQWVMCVIRRYTHISARNLQPQPSSNQCTV